MSLSQKAYKKQLEQQNQAIKDKQDKIVAVCREKILPFLEKNDMKITEARMNISVLEMTLQQMVYKLMEEKSIEDLGLIDALQDDKHIMRELIESLSDEQMDITIEALKWMNDKIQKVMDDENKDRMFSTLGTKI